jgi:hypothetical protein
VYNSTTNEWFILDFFPSNEDETDIVKKHQNGYFMLKQIFGYDEPKTFNREACIVQTGKP